MSTTATIFIVIAAMLILPMVAAIICILVMSGRSNQEQDESVLTDPNKPYHDFIKGLKN